LVPFGIEIGRFELPSQRARQLSAQTLGGMKTPDRIRIDSEGGHVVVRIADYELFDYIEDCFIEQWSLEYSYMTEEEEQGRRIFTMHFSPSVSHAYVTRAVASLPADEIDRISHLNNP